MLNQEEINKTKEAVEEFFQKTNLEVEVEILPPAEGTLSINLKSPEPQLLIGERGETLREIQHLLKMILKKKIITTEPFYLDLDINDYKKKKISYLKEMARSAADEVALNKKEQILQPMSSYERRIIHLELADRQDVSTESVGEEPERKIVIKPRV